MPLTDRTKRLLNYDADIAAQTGSPLAGMDEAGRGPLAGPVVAACVMLPLDVPIDGVYDSKRVAAAKRERLYEQILQHAHAVGVGVVSPEEIDRINILQATRQAMREAYLAMHQTPAVLLVDAVQALDLNVPMRAITKGDAVSYHVAAASIIAKVHRDRLLLQADALYPHYGFAAHKGYGTPAHMAALREHGPSPVHRQTFLRKMSGLPARHILTGEGGERRAAEHLQARGYEILACNYRVSGGEVDIIARTGDTLVFVEVKTRTGAACGAGREAVDAAKRGRIALAAQAYLQQVGGEPSCRFDVIEITCTDARTDLIHLRDAFEAGR